METSQFLVEPIQTCVKPGQMSVQSGHTSKQPPNHPSERSQTLFSIGRDIKQLIQSLVKIAYTIGHWLSVLNLR